MKGFLKGSGFRIFISLFSLSIILYLLRNKLGEAVHILFNEVVWSWFVLSIISYVVVQAIMAYRLFKIFAIKGVLITYKETLYLCVVGLFFNLFLPSAVGGDVAKIYYAAKHTGEKINATTSVILDRLMGFIAIMTIAFTAMMIYGQNLIDPKVKYVVYGFICIMILMVGLLLSKRLSKPFRDLARLIPSSKIKSKGAEVYEAIHSCRKNYGTLIFCVFISLAGQSLFIFMYDWLARGLGCVIDPRVFFLIIPVIAIVSMAPSLGGLGVREAGAIYFFSRYMSPERALALSLLVDMIIYGFGLVSGLIYALSGGLKAKTLNEIEKQTEISS